MLPCGPHCGPHCRPHFALSGHEHLLALNLNKNISNGTVFASIGSSGNVQDTLKNPSLGAWNASGIFNYGTGYNGNGWGSSTSSSDTLRSDALNWDLGDWKFQAAYSGFAILTLNSSHVSCWPLGSPSLPYGPQCLPDPLSQ